MTLFPTVEAAWTPCTTCAFSSPWWKAAAFTGAAQTLQTTTAHVSRAVAHLETHLRTRLLHRTTRRIALTEAGQRYLARCEQILAYVEEAEAEAGHAQARPEGRLRVHSMTGIGQHYVIRATPAIAPCTPRCAST